MITLSMKGLTVLSYMAPWGPEMQASVNYTCIYACIYMIYACILMRNSNWCEIVKSNGTGKKGAGPAESGLEKMFFVNFL